MKINWKKLTDPYPWSFIGFILLTYLVPKFYDLSNVYWIGKISFEALAITEQYEFIGVSIEVVNEMIPFGVLALVAQNYKDKEKILSILKMGLIIQLFFSILLMCIVVFLTSQFVTVIGTQSEIIEATKTFLALKAIALPFESISILLLIGIKSMRKGKEALYLVILSVVLNMVLDLFLISDKSFSLHLGIRGVALGYVISKIVLALVSFVYLIYIMNIKIPTIFKEKNYKKMFKPLFRIGGWTGLDSLTRNLGYIATLMVLNLIGVNEFGGYGLAMWVMWTLIIPALALAEGTNVVVGNLYGEKRYKEIPKVIYTSILFSFITMLAISILGIFFWDDISWFFNPNPDMVQFSIISFWWLIIPYIFFAIGIVIKSFFIGTGETRYIFFISLVANVGIIAPFVILARLDLIGSTYVNVMILFFIVFVEDLIVTIIFANRVSKRIIGEKLISKKTLMDSIGGEDNQ
ncbi:MAG: MATE family efflux transporter [Candidatus Thorarchaeota archaeon]